VRVRGEARRRSGRREIPRAAPPAHGRGGLGHLEIADGDAPLRRAAAFRRGRSADAAPGPRRSGA
jgi:hypothetical protein